MKVITINAETGKRVYSKTEVATICGVSAQTIKLWEEYGRVPTAERCESGYRWWDEDALEEIKKYAENPIKCGRKKKVVE